MDKEAILKFLATLGIKVTVDGAEGTLKEADAVKLVEEQFKAANLGLVQKRDELLAEVVKYKEKITTLETETAAANKKIGELDTQLKKNSPDDVKKYYEGQLKEVQTKHAQELAGITAEKDKYQKSHYERIKTDAINEAIKDINFVDGLKDGFISLAMLRNTFEPKEIDGKTVFLNQGNETIDAVLHKLSLSNEGKAYIQNGNKGGGAQGGTVNNQTGQGGIKMSRSDFNALAPQAQMDFTTKGGSITD